METHTGLSGCCKPPQLSGASYPKLLFSHWDADERVFIFHKPHLLFGGEFRVRLTVGFSKACAQVSVQLLIGTKGAKKGKGKMAAYANERSGEGMRDLRVECSRGFA